MCGIAGLFIKDPTLEPDLGRLLARMTSTLRGRGPDSAGFAIYADATPGLVKLTFAAPEGTDAEALATRLLAALGVGGIAAVRHTHAVVTLPAEDVARAEAWLSENAPEASVMSTGNRLEIYKDVGDPDDVAAAFAISRMAGSHGISHTRMATESAVTTNGAHPFSTGADQCLVHNGSLSNHASLRRALRQDGIRIRTENDSEVAAGYLTRKMRDGESLDEALTSSLKDLDGFFTFVVGTENGFSVLRDPIACKPAVMAETDRYVAFASEFKSLTVLPDIASAKVWEPKPATVYFWEHS
ncbi:class II glutamine amidotransferase [Xanthobacter aminoxidans]|uniref:class II glutamine amidotransferase n=1 Tax=Xanthobacter aminoxidans TaxID=186280 RepID=UPI0020230530|nr:glutamine amidotransferase family protein [Xanthobacter aminoxidans]MCL8383358.1 glutamine amidotransferase family protein [Xanthobacter aminoxidans]